MPSCAQLEAWDKVIEKKSKDNPLFVKVLASQKAFAARASQWQNDYMVDFKMAYNHYFSKKRPDPVFNQAHQPSGTSGWLALFCTARKAHQVFLNECSKSSSHG